TACHPVHATQCMRIVPLAARDPAAHLAKRASLARNVLYALCCANKAVDEARVLLSRANFHARGHVDGRGAGRANGSGDISRGEPAGEDVGDLAVDRRQHSPIEGRPVAPGTGAVRRRLRIKENAVRRPRIGKRTLYIRATLDTHGLHYGDSPLAADV